VQNLSHENWFDNVHENEHVGGTHFYVNAWFGTKTLFDSEEKGILEIVYLQEGQ